MAPDRAAAANLASQRAGDRSEELRALMVGFGLNRPRHASDVARSRAAAIKALNRSAQAHDRTAVAHDRAADHGWGDARVHRAEASRHRSAAIEDRRRAVSGF